jgi:hypothetical protein
VVTATAKFEKRNGMPTRVRQAEANGNGNGHAIAVEDPPKAARRPATERREAPMVSSIPPLTGAEMTVTVEFLTPLVIQRFSKKSRDQIIEKQTGTGKVKQREKRDPVAECKAALYVINPKRKIYAALACWFKHALVSALQTIDRGILNRSDVQRAVWIKGELLPLVDAKGRPAKWVMREDMVRTQGPRPTSMPRWRPEFPVGTRVEIPILIRDVNMVNPTQIPALLDRAGMGGVGEGRPQKCAHLGWGQFQVVKNGRPTRGNRR